MNNTKSHKGLNFQMLYEPQAIQEVVGRLAKQINAHYQEIKEKEGSLDLVIICVLKGAFMFYSDLVKLIEHNHSNQFIKARSY